MSEISPLTLRILRPASFEKPDMIPLRSDEFRRRKISILYDLPRTGSDWPYTSSSAQERVSAFVEALEEEKSSAILCARGGYGCSDLLEQLPWPKLRRLRPKTIVGFSDISALHAAFYTHLGWRGLHAPMPASELWGKDNYCDDIDQLVSILRGTTNSVNLSVEWLSPGPAARPAKLGGRLFGGCFSVLTNLIGTRHFPPNLTGMILFLEDSGENPGRLMRFWNQWLQSGTAFGLSAIILGKFLGLGDDDETLLRLLSQEFCRRSPCPVLRNQEFGHTSPNIPLMIGAPAEIRGNTLCWQTQKQTNFNG